TLNIAGIGLDEDCKPVDVGFIAGDKIVAINGTPVENSRQMQELVSKSSKPAATLKYERTDPVTGEKTTGENDIPLFLKPDNLNFETGHDAAHIYSMVPRLKINYVNDNTKPAGWKGKLQLWWRRNINKQIIEPPLLKKDDIIVKIGETDYPTYTELRAVTAEHKDKEMKMLVLRKDESGKEHQEEVVVTPRQQYTRNGDGPVTVGIYPVLDASVPIVAKTIAAKGPTQLEIPSGALITAVDGEKVANFFDVMRIIRKNQGKRISIDYRVSDEVAGNALLNIPTGHDNYITAKADFEDAIPFAGLRETFKATGPIDAIGMGIRKTSQFITQTLMTLKRLFSGAVSPTTLSGPLGIVTMSYTIVSGSIVFYIYFLGLISSCIAVMNLLPLPVVDGGVIVLLIIEKIKGSPLSQKVQGIISYAGVVFILALFGWLLFNDALNIILT
ncbi:MAG: site-2 protease family protein, partial [Phycisphaerae bacterium]|nr:site-2 protease family protein [Phycisphaerae bacterium]